VKGAHQVFLGAITRLLNRSMIYDFIFFPAFVTAVGVQHCNSVHCIERDGYTNRRYVD
jgi:hypothetical protein